MSARQQERFEPFFLKKRKFSIKNSEGIATKKMKRKRPDKAQKTLEHYMHKPGWTPLQDVQHKAGIMLSYREAGGGGDCMFHSLSAVLGGEGNFMTIRAQAASAVTPENAPDILMDMTAQIPATLDALMDVVPGTNGGQFSPEILWNACKGSREAMAEGLRRALLTPGNHAWGDATIAALVELAMNVNIILLAVDTGVKMPPTPRELLFARTIFGKWVENMFAMKPELAAPTSTKEAVLKSMMAIGLTWEKALALSRMETGYGRGRWLRGRRQPLGSIREICQNPASGNLSAKNYRDDRPTVIIWNRSNAHWVPIAVGPSAETVIPPGTPLRQYVDELMK